ncbi:hypothetical protein GCM10009681_10680 [Luedemannella helvata]|uniref:Uncharacterized protein n=2 Tax=Luedemannella helvata TaxID=349315 RepID=A0ABP4VZH1_9ACTN
MLAQAPAFLIWYRVFTAPTVAGEPNALLAHGFFGGPLSTHLVGGGHPFVFVALLLIVVALAVVSLRRTRRVAAMTGAPEPPAFVLALPFLSVLSALFLPLAAVLYLVTTLAWSAAENVVLRRGLPAG